MYRVEYVHWVAGSGISYTDTIDNVDAVMDAEELAQGYGSYLIGEDTEHDWVRLIDSETDEIIATADRDDITMSMIGEMICDCLIKDIPDWYDDEDGERRDEDAE